MPSHKKRIYTRIKFLYRLLELFFLQQSYDQFLTPVITNIRIISIKQYSQ